ncbi:helix-turn-helix transcriptional regulator [Halalkalicoccus jeotgali]|uniref:Uncharacterized protein n=1 Tax=Halalkalicoccus jeotgali (strain DSM 18796 / CECT 7217 / JCM 14584 / KCTC 4019 / B3) TaxID=795797 RepID=D8J3U9_HALJB|nr:MarR family transcriptional regulator [Halalkalicoccus jeotgali]ADJ13440.1 hypothetical protein HacjB3_00235 [Halalkalicoccus jeotgali B3]ELY33085.1 hypothetical protein C497_19097 [Halalkalicoccus jeotgali B3]
MSPPDDRVRFLATTSNRVSLLSALGDGPLRPAELVERLDLSRSATHRNLKDLVDLGWASRVEGGYTDTVGGRLVLGAYEELIATVSLVEEYGESLEPLAEAGMSLSPSVLESATVVTATQGDPHAPLRYYTERVRELDPSRFLGIVPVVSPLFNEAHRSLLDAGAEGELVLDSAALSASKHDYGTEFDDAVATEELVVYAHPNSFSFGLSIVGQRVFLGAYEAGQFVACFEWGDPDVREEALVAYETHRTAAREVDATALPS